MKEVDLKISPELDLAGCSEAEAVLASLASVFFQATPEGANSAGKADEPGPTLEARYRVLLDQIPAIVFMAYLDQGIGEAYVSPQIEAALGFSQKEWLEDPVRWYHQIHPDDKTRWSNEAADMFFSGRPVRSPYRVMARDGRVVWFHCEARLVRKDDGEPWFIHGVGFDITELKQVQEALQEERNVVSAIFDTVGALIVVLDREGRIVRFNRACEQMTGYSLEESRGNHLWDLFVVPDEAEELQSCSCAFATIRCIRSTKAVGSRATANNESWLGRPRCCQAPDKRQPTLLLLESTSLNSGARMHGSGAFLRRRRTRSWL
jgi:PAS domain S-box-containing protein